jgi:DinB family protein
MKRYFTLVLGACALHAQTANPLSTELRWTYATIKSNLLKLAEKMPAEHYTFRPTPDVETFGRRVAHIADANMNVCTRLNGEYKPLGAAAKTSKADLVAALKQSFAYCDGVLDSLTDAKAMETVSSSFGGPFPPFPARTRLSTLHNMVRHSNEMYGYMAVYLRLKGVVPPTSAPE